MKFTMEEFQAYMESYIIRQLLASTDHKITIERKQYEIDCAAMDKNGFVIHTEADDSSLTFSLVSYRN